MIAVSNGGKNVYFLFLFEKNGFATESILFVFKSCNQFLHVTIIALLLFCAPAELSAEMSVTTGVPFLYFNDFVFKLELFSRTFSV